MFELAEELAVIRIVVMAHVGILSW
jgi:hypothetical protein